MDDADRADIQQDLMLKAKLNNISSQKLNTSNPSGLCWAEDCRAETGHDRRWCSHECRNIWQEDNQDLSPTRRR